MEPTRKSDESADSGIGKTNPASPLQEVLGEEPSGHQQYNGIFNGLVLDEEPSQHQQYNGIFYGQLNVDEQLAKIDALFNFPVPFHEGNENIYKGPRTKIDDEFYKKLDLEDDEETKQAFTNLPAVSKSDDPILVLYFTQAFNQRWGTHDSVKAFVVAAFQHIDGVEMLSANCIQFRTFEAMENAKHIVFEFIGFFFYAIRPDAGSCWWYDNIANRGYQRLSKQQTIRTTVITNATNNSCVLMENYPQFFEMEYYGPAGVDFCFNPPLAAQLLPPALPGHQQQQPGHQQQQPGHQQQ